MRKSLANAVVPVGWPPLAEVLAKIVSKKIPNYACGAGSRARGVTETDLAEYGARNSAIQKSLSRWWSGRTKSLLSKCLVVARSLSMVALSAYSNPVKAALALNVIAARKMRSGTAISYAPRYNLFQPTLKQTTKGNITNQKRSHP